jgi:hypothetical protein
MRASILALLLGFGLAAATSAIASACQYHAAMASSDQSAPTQTAEAQSATDQGSY